MVSDTSRFEKVTANLFKEVALESFVFEIESQVSLALKTILVNGKDRRNV
jgi:hypothetical protein